MEKTESTQMVGITEITERYLPMSKRKARKFVSMYLDPSQIGKGDTRKEESDCGPEG